MPITEKAYNVIVLVIGIIRFKMLARLGCQSFEMEPVPDKTSIFLKQLRPYCVGSRIARHTVALCKIDAKLI